jgi:hypothetical protein
MTVTAKKPYNAGEAWTEGSPLHYVSNVGTPVKQPFYITALQFGGMRH